MNSVHRGPTAILDFALDVDTTPRRRQFDAPVHLLRAHSLADVRPTIDEAERLARAGAWVVGFVSYEASPAFDPALAAHPAGVVPLAWFAAFHTAQLVEPAPSLPPDGDELLAPSTRVTDGEYHRNVDRIRRYIAGGDVYQVNLTVPFVASSEVPPVALYEQLRMAQGGAYSAYLDLGDLQIMSASPELFLSRTGETVRSRPMKGTAPRGLSSAADLGARDALVSSEKDRAENVMIVDVVRNDLGRVAQIGSVRVPSLCQPERFPRVWQLTSTVEATVSSRLPLSEIFGALFPAGSITGAPKIRATQIIRELEPEAREVYCGAVGVIQPGGDAMFNVAIRTAWTSDGGRGVHLNAGGGVTMDSTSAGELAELRGKLAAFTRPVARPALFETIRIEGQRALRLDRHLERLATSADYFGISFDASLATRLVGDAARAAPDGAVCRARLVLEQDGSLHLDLTPHDDASHAGSLPVALASEPVDRGSVGLYHKTVSRRLYDAARADAPAAFDVLLWNADREATEFTRGNLVAEIDGERVTPPIASGLLAGTLRAELLDEGRIRERVVLVDELPLATRLWFVNSLRGWVPVRLDD